MLRPFRFALSFWSRSPADEALFVPQIKGDASDIIVDGRTGIMSKFIACALVAIALSGCCAFGTGCYVPVAGPQAGWDGLDEPQHDETPKKPPRRKEIAAAAQSKANAQVVSRPQTKEEWEQQAAADRAEEARLTKKLRICNGCSSGPDEANEVIDGVHR
jgi:hypothetical protein